MWKEADPNEVQRVWADSLGSYGAEDIKRALETMVIAYTDYPPTLPQFVGMCRDARNARGQATVKVSYIRAGAPSPEVLAVIHELTRDPIGRKRDPKDWARKIIKRDADGEKVNLYALTSAREALGMGTAAA
jgi:hypothetical protein